MQISKCCVVIRFWSKNTQNFYVEVSRHIQGVKNYVYNVSGMIEEVKTNMFFIWQNFGLCTVLPLDGLMGRWLDFRQMAEYALNELIDMHLLYPHLMYQLCTMHYNKWKPPCSTNASTFQHCRYAVAREWIVNANVLTVLIVSSLLWHRDDPFNLSQTQQHKQN